MRSKYLCVETASKYYVINSNVVYTGISWLVGARTRVRVTRRTNEIRVVLTD